MPLRPWRVSPERYPTPISISAGASLRRHAASSAILALRLGVSATRRDVAASSARSVIRPFYRPELRAGPERGSRTSTPIGTTLPTRPACATGRLSWRCGSGCAMSSSYRARACSACRSGLRRRSRGAPVPGTQQHDAGSFSPDAVTTELLFRDDAYLKTATARVVAVRRRRRVRPHDLLSAGRRPAGRHRLPDPRQRRAHRRHRHAQGRRSGRSRTSPRGRRAPRSRRIGRPRDRLGPPLRADAPAHGAARDVLRRDRAVTGGNIAPDKARLDFDIDITLLDAENRGRTTSSSGAASRPRRSGSRTRSSTRGPSSSRR